MRKGTPAQLIAELTDKIDELRGVNSSKVIVDDEEDVIVAGEEGIQCKSIPLRQYVENLQMKLSSGMTERALRSIIKKLMKFNKDYRNYIDMLDSKEYDVSDVSEMIKEDLENELKDSANDALDLDTIEASDEPGEEIEVDVVENDKAEYLTGMYASIENELKDLTESVAWDSDEDSIYLDVNFADGHVFSFTIPKADLSYDLQDPDKDIEYICKAVREAGGDEVDYEEGEYEDYSDEEYGNEYEEDLYL